MTNKAYDTLKMIALLIMPAGTCAAAILTAWGLPYGEQITATCAALDVFLGVCVKIAADTYNQQNGGAA